MSIVCKDGATRVHGTPVDTVQDLINVLCAVRSTLEEHLSKEKTAEAIALCGQLAYAITDGDTERREALSDQVANLMIEQLAE